MAKTGGSNSQFVDFRVMTDEEYEPIQKVAIQKLAEHPYTDKENFRELAEILGLDEVVTWKPILRVVS